VERPPSERTCTFDNLRSHGHLPRERLTTCFVNMLRVMLLRSCRYFLPDNAGAAVGETLQSPPQVLGEEAPARVKNLQTCVTTGGARAGFEEFGILRFQEIPALRLRTRVPRPQPAPRR
jgi:hypothetical protein